MDVEFSGTGENNRTFSEEDRAGVDVELNEVVPHDVEGGVFVDVELAAESMARLGARLGVTDACFRTPYGMK